MSGGAEVSVVIPAYQASGDITVALDSVFAQRCPGVDVLVVNDGSPDTAQLEAVLAPYASRIRYIVQPNLGASAARNAGIRAARGQYVALLDADDRWEPEFLARQLEYLAAHPACDLVYCDARISGDSPLAGRRFMERAPSKGDVTLVGLIEQRCNIMLSTVVVRRDVLVAAGLFDERLRRGQDFDLWLRLLSRGARIHYQRLVLAERRVRAGGLSGDRLAELQRPAAVLAQFGRETELDERTRAVLDGRVSALMDEIQIERGKRRMAEGKFAEALCHLRASSRQSVKLRMTRFALTIAPQLARTTYLRLRS